MSLSNKSRRSQSEKQADLAELENKMKAVFRVFPELSTTELAQRLDITATKPGDLYEVLNNLEKQGLIQRQPISGGKWLSTMPVVSQAEAEAYSDPRVPKNIIYLDWANIIPQLLICYENKVFVLLIGSKGTGKTEAVRRLAELTVQPLETVNFSLRTREHHIIGRLDPQVEGTVIFKKGSLTRSMEEGGIWYGDEINNSEPDCLIRLDEALDSRRQLSFEGNTIKAKDSWFCIASINPLSHAGTKEMPPQLISRFPVRIYFDYPDIDNELQIVRAHNPALKGEAVSTMRKIIEAVKQIRTLDLPYTPSLRETVTMGKMLSSGASIRNILNWSILNVYYQYDKAVVDKVKELLISRGFNL